MIKKVEISHKTIIFTVFFAGFLWFIYVIRDLILELFVALLITAILGPLVERLFKYKIPKGFSIIIVYLLVFLIFGGSIALIVPPLLEQTTNLIRLLPNSINDLGISQYINADIVHEFVSQLGTIPTQIVKAGFGIFSNILDILTVLIFAFYLLLTRDRFAKNTDSFFGKDKGRYINKFISDLEDRLGG